MAHDAASQRHQCAAPLAGPYFDILLLEFSVCAMSGAISSFGSLGRAILFVAAARACGPFDGPSARIGRPVSVNALAASLRRPFETTRRNANALIACGLLARTEGGLHVPIQAIADPRISAFGDHCHDLLIRMVEDARASNLALPPCRTDLAYDPRHGIGLALDLLLAGFECRDGDDRNLARIALLTAVEWANATESGWMGGRAPRGTTKPSAIARILGFPYATTARNIDALVAQGALIRSNGSLSIPPERASMPTAVEARLALANRARQLIGRLGHAGFPMHQPSIGYIRKRPSFPPHG